MPEEKAITLEGSESKVVVPQKNLEIQGVEEIPTSMIPIPFIKLVQPGSTNVTLSSGKDATPGMFYLTESGQEVEKLHFALLRAKRRVSEFQNEAGEDVRSITIGILGISLEDYTPFILTVSVASFSNFGRLMSQLKKREAKKAWEFGITATTQKIETTKAGRKVKYWVANFQLDEKGLDETGMKMLDDAYTEFAGGLDKQQTPEEMEMDQTFKS